MNIVYLIGNGFDLNLEMPTRYKDFYAYLSEITCVDCVEELKQKINSDIENWSDLEFALGRYLDKIETATEAASLHDALIEHLAKYLESVDNKYVTEARETETADFQIPDLYIFEQGHQEILFDYLSHPHKHGLLPAHAAEIETYRSRWHNYGWNIKIITFNYTRIIEKLLHYSNRPIRVGAHHSMGIILSEVEHIHGYTDERMILGVNDRSQIANKRFHGETSVLDRYIKSGCNTTYALGHDAKCERWLKEANLICLFGLSLGDTDKKWWEIMGSVLRSNCKVIIFENNPDKQFNKNQGPALKAEKERIKTRFLSKTGLDKDFIVKSQGNIHVAYNSNMFKFKTISFKEGIEKLMTRPSLLKK